MHLLIDMGNTRTKWMVVSDSWQPLHEGLYEGSWSALPFIDQCPSALLCSTGYRDDEILALHTLGINTISIADTFFYLQSHHTTALPHINYTTPTTLGHDRIAALCGAWDMCHDACLVIDAGTCITIDYLDPAGTFNGGAIMPSPELQLQAMHHYTARLPLPAIDYQQRHLSLLGDTTDSALLAGTVSATALALQGFINHYQQQQPHSHPLTTLFTGGIGLFLSRMIDGVRFVDDLVFRGMIAIGRQAIAHDTTTIKS